VVPATLLFLLAWQVMIAAMMLPSSLPLLRLYSAASARAPARDLSMAAFIGGYAVVWSAFGLLAFGFDAGLHAAVDSSTWLEERSWAIGGSVLVLAGLFQFTSLKDACLDKCRHPAQFLTRHYRRGPAAGFELGARHGAFCVGCCWALMLVLFAAGMTSLLWMAALTALMIHEKTRPTGARAVPVTGVALLAAASVVLAYGAATAGSV
jgi:predicted metal-binding membrane protein